MRVGILTFHLGPNHGGYLQAYCLCRHIRSLGHDVEIINYKNPQHYQNERFRPWIYRRPLKLYHAWRKEHVFAVAYKQLPLSPFATDVGQVEWERYDVVVIGSDVVWDFSWDWLGHDHVYFGDFGRRYDGRIIAYAPSTGTVRADAPIPEWAARGLSSMDALSARDETTAHIVKRACGRKAPLVVDPTWLDIDGSDAPGKSRNNDELVVYSVVVPPDFRDAIRNYARKRALKIVALGYYHPWADKNVLNVGPTEWVGAMRQASAVVAGTFHGTLYAIKNQSNFITVMHDRIRSRVGRALELTGLEKKGLVDANDLARELENPADYGEAFRSLAPYVRNSRRYLEDNLGNVGTTTPEK